MTAVQYVLLPVLAQNLGLGYAQIGVLRAASSATMTALEIPSALLADKFGEKNLLITGLLIVGVGFIGVATAGGFLSLCLFFLLVGCGAAFQHSLSSALIVKTFEGRLRRRALGTYNAFGDLGKLSYAAAFSFLVGVGVAWNAVVLLLALTVISFACVVWYLLRNTTAAVQNEAAQSQPGKRRLAGVNGWGIIDRPRFSALCTIVFLDSLVQSVFLTFIGFVLIEKGASADHAAGGVVLTLIGGTAGKFAGGLLAAKAGDRNSFFLVQLLTAAGLYGVLLLPLHLVFIILPLAGIVVQGSTTVCYGAVGDYVDEQKSSRAYGIIYTLSSAACVVGPVILGVLADRVNLDAVLWVLIALTLATLVFALSLRNIPTKREG